MKTVLGEKSEVILAQPVCQTDIN